MKKIIISCGLVLLVISSVFFYFTEKNHAYNVEKLTVFAVQQAGIDKADKLMIVAHPDDDVLWGGGHLMDKDYFVVCITNGRNETRSEEFRKVVSASGNNGIILEYPDKICEKRDDWSEVLDSIVADVGLLINYKNWELIVTHNPDGEYGHQHHKLTNRIVTDVYNNTGKVKSELWYFGKYYKKSELEKISSEMEVISEERLEYKKMLEGLYESQSGTINKLSHMNNYEMWTKYEENK